MLAQPLEAQGARTVSGRVLARTDSTPLPQVRLWVVEAPARRAAEAPR